jgi:hypothetical protein
MSKENNPKLDRLNILIDKDIKKKFKAKLVEEEISISEFVVNKIKEYIKQK